MRASQLLFSIGLVSAGVVPQRADPVLARRDPDPKAVALGIAAREKRDLVARQIEAWNDFSTPVSDFDACVVLRALEFLAASLVEPTNDITSEAATQVFVDPADQGGPLVVCSRISQK